MLVPHTQRPHRNSIVGPLSGNTVDLAEETLKKQSAELGDFSSSATNDLWGLRTERKLDFSFLPVKVGIYSLPCCEDEIKLDKHNVKDNVRSSLMV